MSDLLTRLIEAGTPGHLVAEVARELARAEVEREAIEARRSADRERQARRRNVMSRDTADVTAEPLSRPPNENNSNPPTHTPENTTPRAKADPFPCPVDVDETDWAALKANRKAKKAPLTEGAYRQIVRKLDQWARDGWPPGPIVAAAAERGWTTVFETDEMKAPRNGQPRPQPHGRPRDSGPDPIVDALRRATAEAAAAEYPSSDPSGGFGTGYALPAQ
jgi:hypothetical protein